MIRCGSMKYAAAQPASRNTDPVYKSSPPRSASMLPPVERRVIAGIETSPDYTRRETGIFGREVRHYNSIVRAVSAAPMTLTAYNSVELEGAIRLACGEDSVDVREGIPSISKGKMFRVSRSADLFFGGTIHRLIPGSFAAGDTVVDQRSGRVYLELTRDEELHYAVIGLFMTGRLPSCVDWRVIDRISP